MRSLSNIPVATTSPRGSQSSAVIQKGLRVQVMADVHPANHRLRSFMTISGSNRPTEGQRIQMSEAEPTKTRFVFYQGVLFTEGAESDYEFDDSGRMICHNPAMVDASHIRIFDIPGVSSPGMFEVALYEPPEGIDQDKTVDED